MIDRHNELFGLTRTDFISADYERLRWTKEIHFAARAGLSQVCLSLTSNSLPANVKDYHGRMLFFWAAVNEHIEVVKLLLDLKDVAVDSKDFRGRTTLTTVVR
jgi:ankyrin repeat protein